MSILDSILGTKSLRKQRNLAKDFATEFYGGQATAMTGQKAIAKQQAVEGISDKAEDSMRTSALSNIFSAGQGPTFGGNAATAIGMNAMRTESGQQAMTQLEGQIGMMDEQSAQQGREAFGAISAEQSRLFAVEKAAMRQADMQYEAEKSARRQELFGVALGLGAAYLPGSGIGGKLKSIFGSMKGGEEVEQLAGEYVAPEFDPTKVTETALSSVAESYEGASPFVVATQGLGFIAGNPFGGRIPPSAMQNQESVTTESVAGETPSIPSYEIIPGISNIGEGTGGGIVKEPTQPIDFTPPGGIFNLQSLLDPSQQSILPEPTREQRLAGMDYDKLTRAQIRALDPSDIRYLREQKIARSARERERNPETPSQNPLRRIFGLE